MKIYVDLPASAMCAIVNYVFMNDSGGLLMAAKNVDALDIFKARKELEEIAQGESGGADNAE